MYRAVFVSDVHFGTTKKEELFLEFLENIKTHKLFLVGDIISFSVDRPTPNLDRLFNIIKNKECEVIYLWGNHERENLNINSSLAKYYKDIKLYDNYKLIYKHKAIFIEHGDSYHYKDIVNRAIKNRMLKSKLKLYKSSHKKYPKYRSVYYMIKPVIKYVLHNSYRKYITKQAHNNGCNVAICGHLHQAEILKFPNSKYINCGDWIKSCSYIVLKESGQLEIKYYKK